MFKEVLNNTATLVDTNVKVSFSTGKFSFLTA